jgi:hypothetical protein
MSDFGGQPPFDHRRIPESPDDIELEHSWVGILIGLIIGVLSLVLFVLGVDPP